uniref:Uncharacterized protein n=1 Tax=Arundo donax TaxID=35708 RepID=A0A0A9AU21_ARUDO
MINILPLVQVHDLSCFNAHSR